MTMVMSLNPERHCCRILIRKFNFDKINLGWHRSDTVVIRSDTKKKVPPRKVALPN